MSETIKRHSNLFLEELDGTFYVAQADFQGHQWRAVHTASDGSRLVASLTDRGLEYVAKGQTERAAKRLFAKLIAVPEDIEDLRARLEADRIRLDPIRSFR